MHPASHPRKIRRTPSFQANIDVLRGIRDITSDISGVGIQPAIHHYSGDTWTGTYKGKKVALKTITIMSGASTKAKIDQIKGRLRSWIQLQHPNVLQLCGTYDHWLSGFALVFPWIHNEGLPSYLATHNDVDPSAMIHDVLKGIVYLHSLQPPVVHADLRAANVYVRPTGEACLANFALYHSEYDKEAIDVAESEEQFHSYRDVARWVAPERVDPLAFGLTAATCVTPAADIYSFGMFIYEIYSKHIPLYRLHIIRVYPAILAGTRPSRDDWPNANTSLSTAMWGIAQACWKSSPNERPTATDIEAQLAPIAIRRIRAHHDDAPDLVDGEPSVSSGSGSDEDLPELPSHPVLPDHGRKLSRH